MQQDSSMPVNTYHKLQRKGATSTAKKDSPESSMMAEVLRELNIKITLIVIFLYNINVQFTNVHLSFGWVK